MASFYDEIEIEDMEFDEESFTYYYPCPCGDRFEITLDELKDGDDVAKCPSCSLLIRIIYDPDDLPGDDDDDEGEIMLLGTSIGVKSSQPTAAVKAANDVPAANEDKVSQLVPSIATQKNAPNITVQPNGNAPVIKDSDKPALPVSGIAIKSDAPNVTAQLNGNAPVIVGDGKNKAALPVPSTGVKIDTPNAAPLPVNKAPNVGGNGDKAILMVSKLSIAVEESTAPAPAQRSDSSTPNTDGGGDEATALPLSAEIAVS
ncbi:Diphthamide biosynthesis protein 3 [Coemansia sp. RSA 2050]|nr:Diphthamide biosynthesis protein 3 [Coemansia sp. RSA 2050]